VTLDVTTLRLQPFGREHLDAFAATLADPEVQRFTRLPAAPASGFAAAWLARYEDGRRDGTCAAFAIVDGEGGFLGAALAPAIDAEARTVELGYLVVPAARGRGVATAALSLLTDWAFAELGALRIELLISVENDASKRVAERCGYRREGVLRSTYVKEGVRDDTEIWSRLPTDL